MFTVRLKQVPENGSMRQSAQHLELADLDLGPPFSPAGVELSYELTRMMNRVFGRVQAQTAVRLSCGRCLADFEAPLGADFKVQFESRTSHGPQAEVDVDADDVESDVAYFDGEELPVGEELRQELELQIPFAPLCRKDCKGRCSTCGQDLNAADCGHSGPQGNAAFSALKDLFNDPERT